MADLATIDRGEIVHVEETGMLATIERMTRDPSVDVDKLERLLAMAERMRAREAETEFNAAMRACQAEMPLIFRDATNGHTKKKYATLESVNSKVTPIASKHGFALTFGTADSSLEKHIRITCRVAHVGGHSIDRFFDLPVDIAGAKSATQASGSTVTYGRRYLILLIFNLSLTDQDNDGMPTPGDAPQPDATKPEVKPRAQRNEPSPRQKQLAALLNLWVAEKAGQDKSMSAFCEWAGRLLETKADLSKAPNWTDEMIHRAEEACK